MEAHVRRAFFAAPGQFAHGEGNMKFSYVMLPDYPLEESLRAIKLADELGFYACYAADETWHKDLWLLFAAAARDTTNIRLGPSLSGVVLREPTLIAQAAATLDELTNGRAEVVLGSGNFGLLAQYNIDWKQTKPLSRVKESVQIIRRLLDDGAITFDGEFFSYHGLFTFARPVQERLPVKIGSMRGPKSFEVAGEFSDGCHHCLSYSRQAYEYAFDHFRAGAERAGKNPDDLDFAAWVVTAVGRDSAAAKQAARSMVGIYASSMSHEQLMRNGIDPSELTPIVEAMNEGELAKSIELTSPELADKMSISGTPEEVVSKIKSEIEGTGVNHVIAAITDASLVKAFTGQTVEGVAGVDEQLRLLAEEVMPSFR
jgi:5,10-methylenetetrahydromethanopterin reductase